jgi:2-oxoglutarate ferredoxin oxidoreductase subunit alpha
VIAPRSPADCFDTALEAARIAITYRTPVIVLSDGYLANGSEPWLLPDIAELAPIEPGFATVDPDEPFQPYSRDESTLARPWAIPGVAGLEHRIGGLEKADITGDISYEPVNHDRMVRLRQAKVDRVAEDIGPTEVDDPDGNARVLVLGWGSSYGPIGAACRGVRRQGIPVAQAHLRHLNPFPPDLGPLLERYERVLVPEMNLGQLSLLLRAEYLVDAVGHNRVQGLPLKVDELMATITDLHRVAEEA